jgi:hypothetical protein
MLDERHPMSERPRTLIFCCALIIALACTSPRRDLGQTADEMASAMRRSECAESAAALDDELENPRATLLSDFAGLWLGQTEDALGDIDRSGAPPVYLFPSGSTRILLEVSHTDRFSAQLTFGAGEPGSLEPPSRVSRSGAASASPPIEGLPYPAEPIASAIDAEKTAEGEVQGEQLALDGKLVLAFSTDEVFVSELHLRFGGDGLVGVFDGLPLLNERGFQTRPGIVEFSRVTQRSD